LFRHFEKSLRIEKPGELPITGNREPRAVFWR
jgi:hypothetical protein